MRNKLIYSIIATLLISFSANADIICVKKKVNVVDGQVRIAKNVKRLPDTATCPSGFKLVNDDFNLVQKEEFNRTLAALPTKEETDVLVGKVAEFTELIGDEESGFTKQILELDDAVNNPTTGLATRASQAELTDVSTRVATLEDAVGDDTTGLATKASQGDLNGVSDRVTTLENTISDNTTGLATKASQGDLNGVSDRVTTLEDAVGDDTTGLATRASQAELDSVSAALDVLDATVNNTSTGLAKKVSQEDFNNHLTNYASLAATVGANSTHIAKITSLETIVGNANSGLVKDNNTNKANIEALATTVGDAESGLVKDVEEAKTNIATVTNDVTDVKNTLGDRSGGLVKDVSDLQNQVQMFYGTSVSGVVEIAKADTVPTSQLISLPYAARKAITTADITIDDGTSEDTGDICLGDAANPLAPAGKVCVYVFEGDKTKIAGEGIGVDCSAYDNGTDCGAAASCGWTAPSCNGDADGCVDEADPSDVNCSAHTENGTCAFVPGECSSTVEKPVNRAFRLENSDNTAPIAATWIYQEIDDPAGE